MEFVVQWLWYLLAFVAGSAAAWTIAAIRRRRRNGHAWRSREVGSR